MSAWSFTNPVKLHFGEGEIARISELLRGRSYALVTHPDAALMPQRDRLIAIAGAPCIILDAIVPNPSLSMLRGLSAQLMSASRPDVLVALGGGSVIDSAKFLAAGGGNFDTVFQYLETGERLPGIALPLIAIPTTAGTGSDLTKWATIWDTERQRKLSLNSNDLYAEAVVVDPELTYDLPWSVTLASGLDALSHALESIWNVNASPLTRTFAVAAAQDLMEGLRRLRHDLTDHEARSQMALGATRAGYAFSNTQTALAHNLSYPITLAHNVPHGIACSFCLPEVMAGAIGADAACDEALALIFGDLATAPAMLRHFLNMLGIAARPGDLGIASAEWETIVTDAFDGPRGRNFIGARERFPQQAVAA